MAFVIPPPGARRLSELLDVSLAAPVDAQVLQYIAAQTRWEARTRAATRIRRQGSAAWLDGDVEMVGGSLLALTQNDGAKSLTFSPTDQKRPRNLDIFIPGTLAARTLLVARGIPDPVVRRVDGYFKTAPGTGTDGSNHARLRLRGSTSGTADMIFNALQAEWHLTEGNLSSESGAIWTATNSQVAGAGDGARFSLGAAATFQTIEVMFTIAPTGGPIRVGLANDIRAINGYTLATTPWLLDANGASAYTDVPVSEFTVDVPKLVTLSGPVSLSQGTQYVAVVQTQSPTIAMDGLWACNTSVGIYTGSVVAPTPSSLMRLNASITPPHTWTELDTANPHKARFFGTTLGAVLVGDVIAEVVVTGTPTLPGADLLATAHL